MCFKIRVHRKIIQEEHEINSDYKLFQNEALLPGFYIKTGIEMNPLPAFAVIVSLLALHVKSQSPVDPEIATALKNVIDYYNKTMNLAERAELVEKYYELERDDGVFMAARIKLAPEKMTDIAEELDRIERGLQKQIKNHGTIQTDLVNGSIKKVQEELEFNFGLEDRNFRIVVTDPMTKNIRAVARMEEHWNGVMHEFTEFKNVQKQFTESVQKLQTFGIHLYTGDEVFVVILDEDAAVDEFISKFGKSDDFAEVDFGDVILKNRIVKKGTPKQTSQEIQALTDAMNGLEMDPVAKQLLTGFLADMNKKQYFILERLLALERVVEIIKDESQDYAGYYMDKRTELYKQLNRIKKLFPVQNREEL